MKFIKFNQYKIPARSIAEMMWGRGGTNAEKTNKNGAYYYSCSGHGGFIIDSRILSENEKKAINYFINPDYFNLLIQKRNGIDYVIGADLSYFSNSNHQKKSYNFNPSYGFPEWIQFPIYLFEEDCAWSILTSLTDINFLEKPINKERSEQTFKQWYLK